MKRKIGVIVLAAGSSSRLGQPKQLVKKEGKTLIRNICETVLLLELEKLVVITGADSRTVEAEVNDLGAECIFNAAWKEGLASSIRKGIEILAARRFDAAMILLCDQVNISVPLLKEIVDAYLTNVCKVVYCEYGAQLGPPALFDSALFPALMELKGDRGAKSVITSHLQDGIGINFPGGETDIDTPGDLLNLDE